MLAKELKIATLKKQREFIEKALKKLSELREDGNSSLVYAGVVYPEVIKHFKEEGFTVKLIHSDSLLSKTGGNPIYLFAVDDEVDLSEEELKQAEEYEPKKTFEDESLGDNPFDFLSDIASAFKGIS